MNAIGIVILSLFTKDNFLDIIRKFFTESFNPFFHIGSLLTSIGLQDIKISVVVSVILGIAALVEKIIEISRKLKKDKANEIRAKELHELELAQSEKINALIEKGFLEEALKLKETIKLEPKKEETC